MPSCAKYIYVVVSRWGPLVSVAALLSGTVTEPKALSLAAILSEEGEGLVVLLQTHDILKPGKSLGPTQLDLPRSFALHAACTAGILASRWA